MVSLNAPDLWKRLMTFVFLVGVVLGPGGRAEPQQLAETQNQPAEPEGTFTFRVPVDVVVVNAMVTDDRGNPITDLTADDFTVYEDGKRQTLQTFSREFYRSIHSVEQGGEEPGPEEVVAMTTDPDSIRPRYISLVIDDVTSPSHGALNLATQAVRKFVEEDLQPEDRVSVLAASGRFELPFTADRGVLSEALRNLHKKLNRRRVLKPDCPDINDLQAQSIFNNTDAMALEGAISEFIFCERAAGIGWRGEGAPALRDANFALLVSANEQTTVQRRAELSVRSLAARIHRENEYWSRHLLGVLATHVRSLQDFKGRKSVVFFSDGFLSQQLRYEVQRVVDAALRSQVIFSTIDIRGLYTTHYGPSEIALMATDNRIPVRAMREENIRMQSLPLAELAHETGGAHVRNSNDLYGGLKKIVDSQHFHYVLTYASQANQTDGRYHRITVKLSRPGLKITHRKGYYAARREVTYSGLKQKEILEALQAPGNLNEIPVGMSYNAFPLDEDRYQVEVFTRANFGRLPFLEENGHQTNLLHWVTVAYDEEGRYVGGQEKQLDLKLNDSGLQALKSQELTSKVGLQLAPGRYQLKAVVRESVENTLGSFRKEIVIPKYLNQLRTSKNKRGLMAALAFSASKTDLPLRFRAYVFNESPEQARLLISARVGAGAVNQPVASEGLEVVGVAYGQDGGIASLFGDTIQVMEGADQEIDFSRQMKLRPGSYRLKLAVADIAGNIGTAEQELSLAGMQPDQMACSSLVASQDLEEVAPSVFDLQTRLNDEADPLVHQGFRILARADDRVDGGDPLAVFYKVYNLGNEPQKTRLAARVRLADEGGTSQEFPQVLLNQGPELASGGGVGVAFQLSTRELEPGKYQLTVDTRDLSSGRSVLSKSMGLEVVRQNAGPVDERDAAQTVRSSFNFPRPGAEGVEESADYQSIVEAETSAQKVGLIEAFISKYPQSKRVSGLREQVTWLYWQLNRFDRVVEHGERILAASPSNPQILTILTTAYHALNRTAQVIRRASGAVRSLRQLNRPAYFDQARWKSQIDDLMAQNYAFMGSAYLSQYETDRRSASNHKGLNLDKAYLYSNQAVDLDPRSDFAQFQLGIVFCASNRAHEAVESLAKAVVLKGRFMEVARENLESVYRLINGGSLEGLNDLLAQAQADLTAQPSRSSL